MATIGFSKSIFVNTNANVINDKEEPSTMLLLLNSIAELRNKNIKKATVEFNQSFLEAKEVEELFLSKLLELPYQDLELLFLFLCGPEKNRRSSKQQERRLGLRKKSSVGDLSYSNAGFETELTKSSHSSNSLGRKRSQVSLHEENTAGKSCLRKAFFLRRDLQKADLHDESLKIILEIHLKVENYYPCVMLFVENEMKSFEEHLLTTLDDSQRYKMYQLCIFVANNIIKKQGQLTQIQTDAGVQHCKLACKLLPNKHEAYESLCKIYRRANETRKALAVTSTYCDEISKHSIGILLQKLFCLVDLGDFDNLMLTLDYTCNQINSTKEEEKTANKCSLENIYLQIFQMMLHILRKDVETGLLALKHLKLDENKAAVIHIIEQFHQTELQVIQTETTLYFKQLNNLTDHELVDNYEEFCNEVKKLLLIISHLLVIKTPDDLHYAQIYIDCLFLCDEPDIAQAYLVKLVKEHASERLPMVLLANLRLKLGAYIAATEDFRTLYNMWGLQKLTADLSHLSIEDREEIARVHRLHAFKFLKSENGFRPSAECFSVAMAAIGTKATGLLLSRGLCYMHLNDFENAGADFNQCLDADKNIAAALCARAVLYAATTHVEEAISNFQKAFNLDAKECLQCVTKLPLEHVLTFTQLISQYTKQEIESTVQSRKKQYDINQINNLGPKETPKEIDKQVLLYMEFLCKIFPQNIDYRSTYIECLYVSKEYTAAFYDTNNLILAHPNEPSLHAWKSVLLVQQRKLDDAITQLKSIKKTSDGVEHIFKYIDSKSGRQIFEKIMRKAEQCSEKEKHGEALIYLNVAHMLNNRDVTALRSRLQCFYKIGEMKKWLRDLTKVIQLQPTAEDLCLRARHYQTNGDDMKACEDYMHALDIEEEKTIENVTVNSNGEEVVKLFNSSAWCMVDLGKPREVFRLCDAGLKFDPHHKSLRQLREKTKSHVGKCVIQ